MKLDLADLDTDIRSLIAEGTVIPAHPLALDQNRRLDPIRQRALSRYYIDAGAGGLAVGVHTTQFEIRQAGLYEPVLALAAEEARSWTRRPVALIAGISGDTVSACREAEVAVDLGYHAGLVSPGPFASASEDEFLAHCQRVAKIIPLFGFYLQPDVGGRVLSENFWHRFSQIETVLGIKIAPFNRYRTIDVVRGVVAAGAEKRVTLYTGNDDHIVGDLITPFTVLRDGKPVSVRITGGLLGHWSVWTRAAVALHRECLAACRQDSVPSRLLAKGTAITMMNAAVFDAANHYSGVIAGCHEVLRRQGLMAGTWCLDPEEDLSPGQAAAIAQVAADFPELTDDHFVTENLDRWLQG